MQGTEVKCISYIYKLRSMWTMTDGYAFHNLMLFLALDKMSNWG